MCVCVCVCVYEYILINRMFNIWDRLFKKGQNSIQDKDRFGMSTMESTPETVNSVNALTKELFLNN